MGRKRNEYAFLAMLITAGHYIVRQSLNIAIIEIAKPPKKEFVKVYNNEIFLLVVIISIIISRLTKKVDPIECLLDLQVVGRNS